VCTSTVYAPTQRYSILTTSEKKTLKKCLFSFSFTSVILYSNHMTRWLKGTGIASDVAVEKKTRTDLKQFCKIVSAHCKTLIRQFTSQRLSSFSNSSDAILAFHN